MSQLLTLVRHAKSSWKTPGQADFERPLNARGQRDGPVMASRLLARRCIPDLLLISTARRARQTADYLLETFQPLDEQYLFLDELYLAEPESLRKTIAAVPHSIQHLMIVGHNPGLENLSEQLAGQRLPPMPTLGIRHFRCASLGALARETITAESKRGYIQQSLSGSLDSSSDSHGHLAFCSSALLFSDYPKNNN